MNAPITKGDVIAGALAGLGKYLGNLVAADVKQRATLVVGKVTADAIEYAAGEMFRGESPGREWSEAPAQEAALWRARAHTALASAVAFVKRASKKP